jgi:hypothetical protein
MKRAAWVIALVVLVALPSFGQIRGVPVGEPSPERTGIDAAQQNLNDISVAKFEDASFWRAFMPYDQGRIELRRLNGAPLDKQDRDAERLESETDLGIPVGDSVLGVKVDFIRRGKHYFTVYPSRPLAVEGVTKTLSVWVVGRNFNHVLKVMIADYFGDYKELTVGTLNFLGWKKMTVAIPPQIVQSDFHYTASNGIQILGFKVECDLDESFGRFYMYLDDLSAVSDLFLETGLDVDDMQDIW